MRSIVFSFFAILLLLGSLGPALRPAKAQSGTVYIMADGNVDPSSAPILTLDKMMYTLKDNITTGTDGIVIQRDNIIIDGEGHTIDGKGSKANGINAVGRKNVTITNVRITGFGVYAIWFSGVSDSSIIGNSLSDCAYGVVLNSSSSRNEIFANDITENEEHGVLVVSSSSISISGNNITKNGYDGIKLWSSSNNIIGENNITLSSNCGIELVDSSLNNRICENTVSSSGNEGMLIASSNNTIFRNNVVDNFDPGIEVAFVANNVLDNNLTRNRCGLYLWNSSGANIIGNDMTNNLYAVYLGVSSGNKILANSMLASNVSTFYIYRSPNNYIYHNDLIDNNSQLILLDNSTNFWDDGYPSGGNYWSDYQAKYPTAIEIDSSGLWNTAYTVGANDADSYPLVKPWSTIIPSQPISLEAKPGYSSVTLRWGLPNNGGSSQIQEYDVYRSNSAGGETLLASVKGTTLEYTDETVSSDSLFYYYVTAINSAGEGPPSSEVKCSSFLSIQGLENVVSIDNAKTTWFVPFSIQQNFWIYEPTRTYWAQNIIIVWPLTGKMSGAFEIYNYSNGAPPPPWNKLVSWLFTISVPSSPLKCPVTLRSALENNELVMENDFTRFIWSQTLSSDCYIDSYNSEIVVVGNLVQSEVAFEYPTDGNVESFFKIGTDSTTWLLGSATVIRPPLQPSTRESSTGLQWDASGTFEFASGGTDQGLQLAPDYEGRVVFAPFVQSPVSRLPSNTISVYLDCPANLSMFDSQGNHLGFNETSGTIDQEIPDALYYFSGDLQVMVVLNPVGNYSLQVIGTGNGSYTLEVLWNDGTTGTVATLWNSTGTVAKNSVSDYAISSGISPQVSPIPELSSALVLPLYVMVTLLAAILVYRKKHVVSCPRAPAN